MKLSKAENPKISQELISGFTGGLNTFQDETLIKDSELTQAKNVLISVDGIQPRQGTINYGSSSGTRVLGGFGFYKSDGTRVFLRYATGANNKLQKYVAGVPTDIGTTTYNATARMNFVQARDKAYIFNGIDGLSYFDGTSITVYTALTTPVGLALATAGTAGTTTYSYRISAFNAVGETLACASVAIATGNAILDTTNFINVTWTATAGATGYNIFGRKATGLGETYMGTVYTNAYADKGGDEPSLSLLPPEANTTTGVIGTMAVFAVSRIFVAGNTTYPSRLYFGGTGEQTGNFSASSIGGGGVDVFRNDGSIIRAILPFQGGVIIWKDNAIYKFSFDADGSQKLEEITRSFGGISFRSCRHVENDIIFAAKKDGRIAFYSLGNQENYTSSVLRTNELSIKVSEMLNDVNLGYMQHSAAHYFNSLYMCSMPREGSTVNNRIWVLDTRFGAWTYYDGIKANMFVDYVDTDGATTLYYASEDTGYMVEMFTETRLDNGVAIDIEWATKAFNQKQFNKQKLYRTPVFQFKDVTQSSSITGEIYLNGVILLKEFTITATTSGGAGVGVYLPGFHLPGEAPGLIGDEGSSDMLVPVNMREKSRSIKYIFTCNSSSDVRFSMLSVANTYQVLDSDNFMRNSMVY